MRELRVEDALLYLDQVKVEFGDRPHIYNEFLDIMKTFKTHQIDTPGVIRRVSNLFQGNRKLVLGFNTFLPEGYKIELPEDGNGPPVAVFRAPGETITHILSGPGAPPLPEPQKPAAATAAAASSAPFSPHQGPHRPGPPMGHSTQGLAMRGGPMGQQPTAMGGPGGPGGPAAASAGYPHGPPPGLHLPVQPGVRDGRAFGQPPQMMSASERMEQHQVRDGPPGPMPGRGGLTSMGMPVGVGVGMPPGVGQPPPPPPQQQPPPPPNVDSMAGAASRMPPGAGGASLPPQQMQQPNQPPGMEFDHAINYVTTIKKRFANEPETYKKFLEILHNYQKEQRGIKEVLEEVSTLFSDHPDLLKEFTYFLPDAVQSEAKAQLEQAAQEAEARKRAKMQAAAATSAAVAANMVAPAPQQQPPPQPLAAPSAPPVREPSPPPMMNDMVHAPPPPPPARLSNPIPFGATMGRSREREQEIFRSVVYGSISFKPMRPPRKNALTVAQGAIKNGRPSVLPRVSVQPNIVETDFFEKAKKHLNRKELAADRPSATRVRHTPHMEFLKCLHLFGVGVLNKDELMLLLRGLFMQGHAPKSGINVGGGASNPAIATDAQELLKDLDEILVARGPYAQQQAIMKCKHKCGSKRTRDYDFADSAQPTPSYRMLPKDFPKTLFFHHAGQEEDDAKVLNHDLVCVGADPTMPGVDSPEDYDAIKIRRNAYEEAMFRIEDERFEVDMAIERNALAMRQIEPIAEEVAMLRETEEKDGQPIGRMQYKLKAHSLNSIQINAIGRIYGEKGDEVIEHLTRSPLATLPIIYQRLRQKDQEWRKQKSELLSKWRALTEANYEGSKDFMCYQLRREIEKSLTDDRLLEECKKARYFCSSLEKRSGSSINFGLSSPDRSAILYEPYAVVELKPKSIAHQIAVSLLTSQVSKSFQKNTVIREKIGRIWTEFVMPFFDYPAHWVADEARESSQTEDSSTTIVQYAVGQHVRTTFGDGVIIANLGGDGAAGPRYRVKFPFGIGFVRSHAIMHSIENPDGTKFVRRDGVMEKESASVPEEREGAVRLDNKFKLLFGSECIYLFIRLFTSLVSLLDDIETHIRDHADLVDPTLSYYDPMKSQDEKKVTKFDFAAMITKLKSVIAGSSSLKDFEAFCRRVSSDIVHKMAALPKLVERGATMLKKTAEEDLLLQLYDYCQFTGVNPVELREKCLAISPEASFRIQYNTTNGRLYFSFLPVSETLATAAGDDEDDDDDDVDDDDEDEEAIGDGDVESDEDDDDDDDDDVMDVEDEEEDLRQVKRSKIK